MAASLNFFDTYTLLAVVEEMVPQQTFFRDRYFPTSGRDIFTTDKVLTEYRKGDRKMACFVAPRAGDIPVDRRGYEIHEYTPSYVGLSRLLTLDELKQRGFGEALYANSTAAERAVRILKDDMEDLDRRISRLEEWMAVQTMLNNACEMVEYIDAKTAGETNKVQFYDGTSDHKYTVSIKWNAEGGDFRSDVRAMCKMLSRRGLPAIDLILGQDVADTILDDKNVRELLNRNSGIIIGTELNETIAYPGVVRLGALNFGGFMLNLWCVDESYEDDSGSDTLYFPSKGALVTAPSCGHMMYGAISQIDYGSEVYATHAGRRIPKFTLDQDKDIRKQRLACRPLAAPLNYCPYIYAADVVD